MIVDSHVYLDLPQFDHDRAAVIQRAREAGVELLLTVAMASPERTSIKQTLELAQAHEMVYAAIGVHPHDARIASDDYLQEVSRVVAHPKVAFWGEIGLDYHYRNSPREKQNESFRNQLILARDQDMPVTIHCRDAWEDLLSILEQEYGAHRYRGILHNFTGSRREAIRCSELGLLISFSGIVSFRHSEGLREAARSLRLDQILVETASPYVAPAGHRGLRNEPAHVVNVARSLAEAMDVSFDDIVRNTTRNFRRLIGRPARRTRDVLVYTIRDRLYINLTSRCTAHCVFCGRESAPIASGYDLHLEREHSAAEYLDAVGEPRRYAEIIFCGFGEPTLRLAELTEIGRTLKACGTRLRMNTNGHGNLIHGRDIAPDLSGFLDEVSVSIDAGDAATYQKIVRPDFGEGSFQAVVEFVRSCVGRIPRVTLTAVDLPNLDLEPIKRLARDLGVEFRAREYQPMVGSTDFTKGGQT